MTAKRATIYCRISDDKSGRGAGVERQEADCRELCGRRGWEVVAVEVDNDVSASGSKRRPGYERTLAAVREGRADVIVTWHNDRLARRPLDLEAVIDICETTGATVATVTAGDFDLGTASGRMVARVLVATAKAESERIGERVRRSLRQRRQEGRWLGGHVPIGYRLEGDRLAPDPAAAALIVGMAERIARGDSVASVARWAAESGMRTSRGVRPTPDTVKQVLGRETVAEIVPTTTLAAARARLADNSRGAPSKARRFLLTGIARCQCGGIMRGGVGSNGKPSYRCGETGTGHTLIGAARLDTYVLDSVSEYLASDLADAAFEDDDDSASVELAALDAEEAEALTLLGDGVLTARQFRTVAARIGDRRRELLAGVEVGTPAITSRTPEGIRAELDALPIEDRRALLRVLVAPVVRSGRGGRSAGVEQRVQLGGVFAASPEASS